MPRSVNHVASRAKRKKILGLTRGYFGARKNVWTVAKNTWEKGLTYVAEGSITSDEYMEKLERFVAMRTVNVTRLNNQYDMRGLFDAAAAFYKTKKEN